MKKLNKKELEKLSDLSKNIRKDVMDMAYKAKTSHIGSSFSIVEILVVLYKLVMNSYPNKPNHPKRDRLVLSKGHACSALYSILSELGFFKKSLLKKYSENGSIMMSHISSQVNGVEFSTGSLGHGLPVALGIALAAKSRRERWKTFVILSDGELNEGSNWEAFSLAGHLKIENLFVIIDANKIQATGFTKDIINMEPLEKKLEAFGWDVLRADGHDFLKLSNSFEKLMKDKIKKPKVIIADTIKGKGISFMENQLSWHYLCPNEDEYIKAKKELEK